MKIDKAKTQSTFTGKPICEKINLIDDNFEVSFRAYNSGRCSFAYIESFRVYNKKDDNDLLNKEYALKVKIYLLKYFPVQTIWSQQNKASRNTIKNLKKIGFKQSGKYHKRGYKGRDGYGNGYIYKLLPKY